MDNTPASHETKLGILSIEELNLNEALGLKKVWEFLLDINLKELNATLLNKIHLDGFGFLYEWAGKYRRTNPMVGTHIVPKLHLINELMANLFDDLRYKIESMDKDNLNEITELISWFEHRFIWIHPYTNTNGRMGRLVSNFILKELGYPPLSYANRSKNRKQYINAIRKADQGDHSELENIIAGELDDAIKNLKSND